MRRPTTLAALAVALAAGAGATAMPAQAAVSSASINDLTATLSLDGADDNVTVSVSGGLLVHGQTTGGLDSGTDWDSDEDGDQTVPADGTRTVIVNGGDGNDAITVLAKATELASSGLNGDGGDDVLTGADSNDTLNGGDGNDRLVGGEGRRRHERRGRQRHAGVEPGRRLGHGRTARPATTSPRSTARRRSVTCSRSSPRRRDHQAAADEPGSVHVRRRDRAVAGQRPRRRRFGHRERRRGRAHAAVGRRRRRCGHGQWLRGAGPDPRRRGQRLLSGGGGDDRIVGDRGTDTMNGGAGDDTLVWNNGDGTDVANGDDGRDDVEVNGAPAAGDTFTVQPNGARIKFDRTQPGAVLDRHRLQRDAARQRPRRQRHAHGRRGRPATR